MTTKIRTALVAVGCLITAALPGWADEVRGAPLGAAPPAAETQAEVETDALGPPMRVIPDAAVEFLREVEEQAGKPIETPKGSFLRVPFTQLSGFDYHPPNPATARAWEDEGGAPMERLPGAIRELDGERVMVAGFMVPLAFDRRGNVEAFALSQNLLFCCYGIPPAMHEWVMVTVADEAKVGYIKDSPIAVYGTLAVREELDNGHVLSLYRMAAVEVSDLHEALRRDR